MTWSTPVHYIRYINNKQSCDYASPNMFDFINTGLLLLITIIFARALFETSRRFTNSANSNSSIMINRRGGARIPSRRIPLRPPSDEPSASVSPSLTSTYDATPQDILEAKELLSRAGNLPPELVDVIINLAEYWASSVTVLDYTKTRTRLFSVRGGRPGEDQFLLRTPPLGLTKWSPSSQERWQAVSAPKRLEAEYPQSKLLELIDGPISTLEHPFRKVVFDTVSRDQGWSSHHEDYGTYRRSYTWFDAGLERFDMNNKCAEICPDRNNPNASDDATGIPTCAIRPLWPPVVDGGGRYDHKLLPDPEHTIQRNKHAEKSLQHHRVEWAWTDDIDPKSSAAEDLDTIGRGPATGNGEFVRNLKYGDMVTVWGRARFGAWSNNIERVEVKVYWAL
ncbi:hypothetical protein F4779DRAFT_588288 [Xylariaceae sp. FL0662B]|nr:hypothetical protein F4779DRAFT_588288 [Xylariaceae sp. FL0662B]